MCIGLRHCRNRRRSVEVLSQKKNQRSMWLQGVIKQLCFPRGMSYYWCGKNMFGQWWYFKRLEEMQKDEILQHNSPNFFYHLRRPICIGKISFKLFTFYDAILATTSTFYMKIPVRLSRKLYGGHTFGLNSTVSWFSHPLTYLVVGQREQLPLPQDRTFLKYYE